MSPLNWNRLAPHRPMLAGDALRVERPTSNGERLADMARARMGPIAVTGPAGCGKSTELAAAAKALQSAMVAVLVPLDRLEDMRQLEEPRMLHTIGIRIFEVATSVLRLRLSDDAGQLFGEGSSAYAGVNRTPFLSLLREVARTSHQGRVALLLDGVEKCPKDIARRLIQVLLTVREEAEIVVVVPLELVTGPEGYELLNELRLFPVRPVPVVKEHGVGWQAGRRFLKDIFLRRMGLSALDDGLDTVVDLATEGSSGLPRTFLQILGSAAGYSTIASRTTPSLEDLDAAIRDQKESLRRILRDGDLDVLHGADGTDGLEIPVERRIRLLAHGLLLEYEIGGRVIVHMNRLLSMGDAS